MVMEEVIEAEDTVTDVLLEKSGRMGLLHGQWSLSSFRFLALREKPSFASRI
jgi:hypothetical protein